jgi:hypothetical protein
VALGEQDDERQADDVGLALDDLLDVAVMRAADDSSSSRPAVPVLVGGATQSSCAGGPAALGAGTI